LFLCLLTPFDLLKAGDYTGVKKAVAHIADEKIRTQIAHFVDEHQSQRNTSHEHAATSRLVEHPFDPEAARDPSNTSITPLRPVP
jgi:hypothetical protein